MSCQSFSNRELLDHFSKLLDGAARITNDARAFQKSGTPSGEKNRARAVRRQYVARPRKVIADDGWRVSSDKNGAGIFDFVGDVFGLGHQNFNVFGRDVIHKIDCVFLACDDERDSFVHDRNARNRAAIEHFQLHLHLVKDRGGDFFGTS